ncbi:DUF4358 domain-containing protein [Paenibacillus melissococcoides]|uniref:DUF4358 domain-containing protein n=1 Tax=Paenibacillus melissococcoides TaxID=2912268 RepID=A0ABN8U4C0_9BACL|nr:DUF4358 domain-containing protein [Paenibacillus melissococcoides]CAH8245923.1 DUF4358 domain-containing protein [Paenibacillus melissococcoides]CAH8712477.1 DUF4358 domain-containing protein [Paenibacillus melissococcoides]CAH8713223.1 DUF4358 domain-containing protein [Paenibacillus melissococcoides]
MRNWLAVIMILAIAITGCTTKKEEAVQVPVADIMTKLKESAEFPPMAEEIDLKADADMAGKLRIDPAQLAEGRMLKAMISVKADEIIVLKAADEKYIEDLKKALEEEGAAQEKQWSTYLPDQHEIVKNRIIKQEGLYLALIISEKAEDVEQAFTTALNPDSK